MDPDRYLIAPGGPEVEVKIKGSRFLGRIFPAADLDEAQRHLAAVRQEHYSATHHCWAVRTVGPDDPETRYDDDGEPSGTAGVPILQQLERADWHLALCVVTRYYGGTKLGTGGLAKAYGQAAAAAMEAVKPRVRYRSRRLVFSVPFDDLGTVETLIAKSNAAVLEVDRQFGERPAFTLTLKASRAEAVEKALIEATAGRVHVQR